MSRKDFSQQFPTHRDFSQQFPTHRDFSQQFPSQHDLSQQLPSSSSSQETFNTPPEDIFPVFTTVNEPVPNPPVVIQQPDQPVNNLPVETVEHNGDEEVWQELLRVQAEEEREARDREQRAKAKQDRRNRRAQWRWENGIDSVPMSEDDSSASYSSQEGFVSDDSFY